VIAESEFSDERGVQNPRIVDLVSFDSTAKEVVLLMFEQRPWGSVPEQLDQIQEKLNNYLDYVLDGYFHSQYPQYREVPVLIRFECPQITGGAPEQLVSAIGRYLASIKFKFEVVHPAD